MQDGKKTSQGDYWWCIPTGGKEVSCIDLQEKARICIRERIKGCTWYGKKPKKMWSEIKKRKVEITGNFTEENMFMYVRKLYHIPDVQEMSKGPCNSDEDNECFNIEEVKKALEHMKNGKAGESSGIYVEMLKWLPQEGLAYVTDILNQAYNHGFPHDWQENCIKALQKGGDKNEVSNYKTIMLGTIMSKLFGSLLEKRQKS